MYGDALFTRWGSNGCPTSRIASAAGRPRDAAAAASKP